MHCSFSNLFKQVCRLKLKATLHNVTENSHLYFATSIAYQEFKILSLHLFQCLSLVVFINIKMGSENSYSYTAILFSAFFDSKLVLTFLFTT